MIDARLTSIAVATDGSPRAETAVSFAAKLAGCFGAELTLVHVSGTGNAPVQVESQAEKYGGKLLVVQGDQPSEAIVEAIATIGADAIVLGNLGMSDRKEFLLGNVPNRVSHQASCTVIIVDTRDDKERKRTRR